MEMPKQAMLLRIFIGEDNRGRAQVLQYGPERGAEVSPPPR